MKNNKKWYLGLDIGTDSIGWAATDNEYKLLKYKNNKTWGSCTFDEANQAVDRRMTRTARRRLQRRKFRTELLQGIFAKEIAKVDDKFFIRIKESQLWADDKSEYQPNNIFNDTDYTDTDYHNHFPTIHHLICELMESKQPHDVRLVYLACAYLVKNRGHFLNSVSADNIDAVKDFSKIYNDFLSLFEPETWNCTEDEFKEVLSLNVNIRDKTKSFVTLLFNGKTPVPIKQNGFTLDPKKLIELLSGAKKKLSEVFNNEQYKELENDSITLSDVETLEKVIAEISEEDAEILLSVRKMYDWSILINLLTDDSISKSKVNDNDYEKHKKDLEILKGFVRKYLGNDKYNEVFRRYNSKINNYVSYSANINSVNMHDMSEVEKFHKCNNIDFCDYIKKQFKDIVPENNDKDAFSDMMNRLELKTFCPKQVVSENRVIPYQLYYDELKKILNNASEYLCFLNDKDSYGSNIEKILSIMKYRVPYYVGPLGKKGQFSWIVRKTEEKILPWNFDEVVDKDASENEFIRRMTNKCTYCMEYDVLAKNSLIYQKFNALNIINNIRINNIEIDINVKQELYNALLKKKNITYKTIINHLESCGYIKSKDEVSGIDKEVKFSLKSHADFNNLICNNILTTEQVEKIIHRITCTEDRKRLRKWLKDNFDLSDADVKYISNLKYKDFGRLSNEFLTDIYQLDTKTGEISGSNIITALWETNNNIMQLLSNSFGYKAEIDRRNAEYTEANPKSITERMNELMIPSAVRRPVTRTLDIVKELKKLIGSEPERIFIEMARDTADNGKKGNRTDSRRTQITNLYKNIAEDTTELLKQLELKSDDELRSEKIFLYFMQLGRCMYSGKSIDINDLASNSLYNIDHIYPQTSIKDDSLDNKVLVLSTLNGEKGDVYPISADIRKKMFPIWKSYFDSKLISEKKFKRLTRSTNFSDEELAGFISRQIVETRQSTKAVALLLSEIMPDSKIIYVKAGLVSKFRDIYKFPKCRAVNDLHHAKDAYLNIVMGNVYYTKFTDNPINFIKNRKSEKYSLHLSSLLGKKREDIEKSGSKWHRIERNGICAWNEDGSTFRTVENTMLKNNIRYTRFSFKRKGRLFDQNPYRKSGTSVLVPRKKDLSPEKYGGYKSTTATCFVLVKYHTLNNQSDKVFIPVELMYFKEFMSDEAFAKVYAISILNNIVSVKKGDSITDVEFLLNKRLIKMKTMVELDGMRMLLCAKSNKGASIEIAPALPLILNKNMEEYIRNFTKVLEKIKEGKINSIDEQRDKISSEKNIEIYNAIANKLLNPPFNSVYSDVGEKLLSKELSSKFATESSLNQIQVLSNVLRYTKTGSGGSCDLECIGGKKKYGVRTISSKSKDISKKYNSMYIIDQSPTGLIEHKSDNLFEL